MVKVLSLAAKFGKWLLPKLVSAAKVTGKVVKTGTTKYINVTSKYASKGIQASFLRMSTLAKTNSGRMAIKGLGKVLSSDKVVKPIIKDLTFKAVKEVTASTPYVGKVVKPGLDVLDLVIGIPFI